MLKIVRCAWENSDVRLSVQDFHRLHFEIVTSAAASIPKEVRAYPERGWGPVSQAHLERGLRLDLVTSVWSLPPVSKSAATHCTDLPCEITDAHRILFQSFKIYTINMTHRCLICPRKHFQMHFLNERYIWQLIFGFNFIGIHSSVFDNKSELFMQVMNKHLNQWWPSSVTPWVTRKRNYDHRSQAKYKYFYMYVPVGWKCLSFFSPRHFTIIIITMTSLAWVPWHLRPSTNPLFVQQVSWIIKRMLKQQLSILLALCDGNPSLTWHVYPPCNFEKEIWKCFHFMTSSFIREMNFMSSASCSLLKAAISMWG